jgi:hypothetical protein
MTSPTNQRRRACRHEAEPFLERCSRGVIDAASRIAQLAGVALAAGVASFASGYEVGLAVAAATSIGGALTASMTLTPTAAKAGGSGGT